MILLFSLVVAAAVCGIMWRRPDARAAVSGAWQAGKAQAVQEFRQGYQFAQSRLRAGNPGWKNPRRWVSAGLAAGYGTCATIAAANRIRRRAWEGGRERYRQWKLARPIDAEVIAEVVEKDKPPQEEAGEPPLTGQTECPKCREQCKGTIPADKDETTVTCKCGFVIIFYREPPEDPPPEKPGETDPKPEQAPDPGQAEPKPEQTPDPGQHPEPEKTTDPETTPEPGGEPNHHNQEEPMQVEATGLTSYATAHTQFAAELRAQVSGSESLAASMADILAPHSDLIGDTAILQDLLNQAAAVADRIAERSLAVANN